MPRVRRVRREDVLAGTVVAIVIIGVLGLAAFVQIERDFQPEGGALGLPTHIRTCGRSYIGPGQTYSLARIEATTVPGSSPVVLEPILGQIPISAYFDRHHVRIDSGELTCATLVFLHVGPDAYLSYGLEGGP